MSSSIDSRDDAFWMGLDLCKYEDLCADAQRDKCDPEEYDDDDSEEYDDDDDSEER